MQARFALGAPGRVETRKLLSDQVWWTVFAGLILFALLYAEKMPTSFWGYLTPLFDVSSLSFRRNFALLPQKCVWQLLATAT